MSPRHPSRACFALLAAAATLGPAAGEAYVRARTPAPASQPLRWMTNPVPFVMDAAGSKDVVPAAAHDAIRRAFATWEAAPCAWISFREDGVRPGLRTQYLPNGANVNAVVWQEASWPYDRGAIAYTILTTVQSTGQIVDADITLNGVSFSFAAEAGAVPGAIDVESVVTHEVGHFLGLDHTPVPGATMRADLGAGDLSSRALMQDDLDGVCEIYPLGTEPKPPASGGCAAAGDASGSLGLSLFSLLGLAALLGRRRPPQGSPTRATGAWLETNGALPQRQDSKET